MLFNWGIKKKTIYELRKNKSYTVKQLAEIANVKTSLVQKVDKKQLKEVPEPLQTQLLPFLKR